MAGLRPSPTGCFPPAAGAPWAFRQAAWPPRAEKGVCGGEASPHPSTAYVLSNKAPRPFPAGGESPAPPPSGGSWEGGR